MIDPLSDIRNSVEALFLRDPEEEQALEDVRVANKMLSTGELPQDEANLEFIKGLDKQWPHAYQLINLSGQAYISLAESGISPEEDTVFMEERAFVCESVFCYGFSIRKVDGESTIGHAFAFDLSDDGQVTPPGSTNAQFMGWAPIEGTVVDGLSITPERAEDYLEHYLPGILQEIDGLIDRFEDPLDRLKALSDFEIDIHEIVGTSVEKGKQAISYYLIQNMGLEGFVPYSVASRGIIYIKPSGDEEDGKLYFEINDDWQDMLLIPQNINMIPVMGINEDGVRVPDNNRLQAALCAEVHFLDRPQDNEDLKNVIIPISADLKICSNRDNIQRVDTTEEDLDAV